MPLVVEEKSIVDQFIDVEKGKEDFSTFQPRRETHGQSCSKYSSQTPKDSSIKQVSNAYANDTSSTNTTSKASSSSNPTDLNTNSKEDQLQSTRAEMGEVREENERLKTVLARIMKDYRSLESRLVNASKPVNKKLAGTVEEEPDDHLVSLRLGTSSTVHKKTKTNVMESTETTTAKINIKDHDHHDMNMMNQGLRLGLDCKGSEDPKREETGKSQLLSDNYTTLKTPRSTDDHDEVSRQINGKKARVSVRARCDTPTMIDGCQWRKYGQKISKGNPCPRAYYRCTVAPACPVRKQVQRCVDDMSILITTYEGTHNHPLPMGATAMASTTSAAASMLMSGSSSARPGIEAPMAMPMSCSTPNSAFNGLNFSISSPDFSSGLRQYYQPPNPTITLDLTSPEMSNSSSTNANTGQLNNILSANNYTSPTAPRYTSTNFNLSPLEYSNSTSLHANPWSNSGYLGYGSQIYNNRSNVMIGNQTQPEYSFHPQQQQRPSFLQKPTTDEALQSSDQKSSTSSGNLTYTIAKAITTDPSFQSSLKDAITSIVSNGNRKEGGSSHVSSFFSRIDGGGGGSAANQQQANQMALLQSSLGLSTPKSSSASPVENREHMN